MEKEKQQPSTPANRWHLLYVWYIYMFSSNYNKEPSAYKVTVNLTKFKIMSTVWKSLWAWRQLPSQFLFKKSKNFNLVIYLQYLTSLKWE